MSKAESNVETEIKLRVSDIEEIAARLEKAGFVVLKPRVFEINIIYDRDGEVRARGELLRLRRAGDDCVLTFKGQSISGPHKSREEFEIGAAPYANCDIILQRLGFQPIFRYEKFRTEFHRDGISGVIMLDETPIGSFLELEGSADWIDETAKELEFDRQDYLTQSYGTLYLQYCEEHGRVPANMVFNL